MQEIADKHGRREAAKVIGITYNSISHILNGFSDPTNKAAQYFGLEPLEGRYVKQEGTSNG